MHFAEKKKLFPTAYIRLETAFHKCFTACHFKPQLAASGQDFRVLKSATHCKTIPARVCVNIPKTLPQQSACQKISPVIFGGNGSILTYA